MTQTTQKRIRWMGDDLSMANTVTGRRLVAAPGVEIDTNATLLRAARIGLDAMDRCPSCRACLPCDLHWPGVETPIEPQKREKAHDRYARAYADGQVRASGAPFVPITDSSAKTSYVAIAKSSLCGGLAGDDLLAWLARISEAYRLANPDPTYESGYHPRRCLAWVNGGRKPQKSSTSTRQAAPRRGYAPEENV